MRSFVLSMLAVLLATAAAAQTPPKTPTAEDLRQDVRTFETQVLDVDRSYSPAARAEAKARLGTLEARLDRMTPLDVEIELCRIAALADNGHTGCMSSPRAPSVDVGFFPFGGGIYVFSAGAPEADLLGSRLLGVDGRSVRAVQPTVRSLFGGRPAWRDLNTSYAYSRPAVLRALGLARADDAALYRFRLPDGRIVERRLHAGQAGSPRKWLLPPERSPWSWQDQPNRLRWRDAPAHDAVVVQLRSNEDQPGHPIGAFLSEAERQRAALGRNNVILDLRNNGGGDLTLTRELLAAWPDKLGPHGRVIVLTGPLTFSAGIADAAYLKQAGGRRVILVGEAPGDGLMFFAEGRNVRLPATGLVVRPATERDDLKEGCRSYKDCHAALAQVGGPTATPSDRAAGLKRMPVAVASLDPDVAAPTTIGDFLEGHDSGLATALDLAQPCARVLDAAACHAETRDLVGPVASATGKGA